MLVPQRRAYILERLARDGHIVATELARELDLSEDTIRRDLRDLAREGRLQRVHGGALPASSALVGLPQRRAIAPAAKRALGRRAAAMIERGQIVLIDGGSTTTQLVRQLPAKLEATVVTHSPTIAVELADHAAVDVIVVGGRLFKHSVVTVGAAATEALGRIQADLCFLGVTGIHPDAGLTTGDLEEAYVKRALLRSAAETVVLASREKLGVASPYRIAALSEIDALVVEAEVPDDVLEPYAGQGLEILRADAAERPDRRDGDPDEDGRR